MIWSTSKSVSETFCTSVRTIFFFPEQVNVELNSVRVLASVVNVANRCLGSSPFAENDPCFKTLAMLLKTVNFSDGLPKPMACKENSSWPNCASMSCKIFSHDFLTANWVLLRHIFEQSNPGGSCSVCSPVMLLRNTCSTFFQGPVHVL